MKPSTSLLARPFRPTPKAPPPRSRPVAPPPTASASIAAPRLQPDIIHEDNNLLVLNKPSNVAIQGQHGTTGRRRWDQLIAELKERPESPNIYPVHRLDKSTTGCLVLAKSAPQAKKLSKQFQAHQIERRYLAVVHGTLRPGYEGVVERRLRVDEDLVRVVDGEEEGGMEASTKWKCLSASASHSLLSLLPATGRKHQLRVHCAEVLKAPLVGDYKYGPTADHRNRYGISFPPDSLLLHSLSAKFHTWEKSGKRSTVLAIAEPPAVFVDFCAAVGLDLSGVDELANVGSGTEDE